MRRVTEWRTMEAALLDAMANSSPAEMAAALGWLRPRAERMILADGEIDALVAEGLIAIAADRTKRNAPALKRAAVITALKAGMRSAAIRAAT